MRLWSLHPQNLDPKGLVAVWREGLLALKVLRGETKGYRHHPQLKRFTLQTINAYLHCIAFYANEMRGYHFDIGKVGNPAVEQIQVTEGQIEYETQHLLKKLQKRKPEMVSNLNKVPHPIFMVVPGPIESWERISK